MVHSLRCGLYHDSIKENESRWNYQLRIQEIWENILLKNSCLDKESEIKDLIERDSYLTVGEALEKGFVDKVIRGGDYN